MAWTKPHPRPSFPSRAHPTRDGATRKVRLSLSRGHAPSPRRPLSRSHAPSPRCPLSRTITPAGLRAAKEPRRQGGAPPGLHRQGAARRQEGAPRAAPPGLRTRAARDACLPSSSARRWSPWTGRGREGGHRGAPVAGASAAPPRPVPPSAAPSCPAPSPRPPTARPST
jgi:hypothetical protein